MGKAGGIETGMVMSKKLLFIFLLIFLSGCLLSGFHHHKDGQLHNDCPICATGASPCNINPANQTNIFFNASFYCSRISDQIINASSRSFSSCMRRGPPETLINL
jgi:hypothetical protein